MTHQQALDYVVPAYFHPAVSREHWTQLAACAADLRFVVVNVHNGVGAEFEPLYRDVCDELHHAGVRTVGYIDSAYGRRPADEIAAEALLYQSRYGISGVFLDQASADLDALSHYEKNILGLRAVGARFVVLNPGCHPHPAYADLANVTVTFEGSWQSYLRMTEPAWVRSRPAKRFCHLVYDTPGDIAVDPVATVREHHARTVCLTEGTAPNVWDRLPTVLAANAPLAMKSVA